MKNISRLPKGSVAIIIHHVSALEAKQQYVISKSTITVVKRVFGAKDGNATNLII